MSEKISLDSSDVKDINLKANHNTGSIGGVVPSAVFNVSKVQI